MSNPLVSTLIRLCEASRHRKHPLNYANHYQLVVMVVLSSRSTDTAINSLASPLFKAFPSMAHLAAAKPEDLHPYIKSVPGFVKKSVYLVKLAKAVGADENIPTTMEGLTALSGIGRKSANVILREAGCPAEGIIVDLHVLRAVPRIGITNEEDPEKVERSLMSLVPRAHWGDAGMALSFLGREVCRPTDPKCGECPMSEVCRYCRESHRGG